MPPAILFSFLLNLAACKGDSEPEDTALSSEDLDADGDGFVASEDCDDGDPQVFPEAAELCDGVDNDCDGETDEEAPSWYADTDADGFGAGTAIVQCEAPEGFVADNTDCDDTRASINPGMTDICDGVDSDCDGEEVTQMFSVKADGAWVDISDQSPIGTTVGPTELLFCSGRWEVDLQADHDLTLLGLGDVTLDGAYTHGILANSAGTTLHLENLTLAQGFAEDSDTGAAIGCHGEATLLNVHVADSTSTGTAPAIFAEDCQLTMTGGSVTGSDTGGGVLKTWGSSDVDLTGVDISDNGSTASGILNLWGGDGGSLSIASTILDGNTSADTFGAISNYGGERFTCTDGTGFGAGVRNHNNAAISVDFDTEDTYVTWEGCDMASVGGDVYFRADAYQFDNWISEDASFACRYDSTRELVICF